VKARLHTLALLLLLGSSAIPAPVRAQAIWGQSTTSVRGFVRPANGDVATYLPFYERVELHVRRLGVEGLSLHTAFWGLLDVVDLQDRYRTSGDMTTFYLQYRGPEEGRLKVLRGLEVAAGRQLVALGPTLLEQVDGGKLHYRHPSGLEVGLFGGAPTGTRVAFAPWPVDEDSYSQGYGWLAGGRLGFMELGRLTGGLSFVHRRYHGRIADNDLGMDLSCRPLSALELAASGAVSLEALRPKQVRVDATAAPLRPLTLSAGYLFSSPDLFIPRTSIFAVFSEETFQEAALEARWQTTRVLTLEGAYGRRFYATAGGKTTEDASSGANRASVRAVLRFGQTLQGRATALFERLEAPDNATSRARLAVFLPLLLVRRPIGVILDLDTFVLDDALRDARFSLTGSGFVEVPLRPSLRLLAGGSGGTSPLLRKEGSFLVRLTWDFAVPAQDAPVQVQRGRLP